jgi:hypothetical protein
MGKFGKGLKTVSSRTMTGGKGKDYGLRKNGKRNVQNGQEKEKGKKV